MKDLTREHELKTIFLFSLPILVGNLFQQLYNLADTVIVEIGRASCRERVSSPV